jgi:hypothetical protein
VSSASTSIDPAADKVLAAGIGLQTTDFPSEWASSPQPQDAATTSAEDQQVAACLGIPDTEKDRTAEVMSDDFTMAKLHVSSDVSVFRSTDDVNTDSAAIAGPKAQPCLNQQYRSLAASQAGAGSTISGLDLKVMPGAAPGRPVQKATVIAHISASAAGAALDVYDEVVYLAEGRVEATVDFLSEDGPVPTDVVDLAAGRVATRLEAS